MKKEMPLKEEMEDAAAQYPVELEVKESLQVPSEAAKSSSVSLKMLRSEALLDNEISRHLAFSALSREKLRVITQGSDSKRMFWASYELAIRFPAELPYLESLLRIKNTNTVEKRNLMILVADIYRNMGQEDKAERLYRDALRLK
jgi:hypothetical protein